MAKPGPASLVGLAILVSLSAGVVAGTMLTAPGTPTTLQQADDLALAPVSARELDDARTVTLQVTAGREQQLLSPVAGRVTATTCRPGGQTTSGTSQFSIDGAPLLQLSTTVPPFRDLAIGDRGADVAALHTEMHRLGQAVHDSDQVDRQTVQAYRALAESVGSASPDDGIPVAGMLWLPAASVTVSGCEAMLGAQIEVGDPLLTLDAGVTVHVTSLPGDALGGARVLVLDDVIASVDGDGAVADDEGISAITGSATYRETPPDEHGGRQIAATWRLAEPVTAAVVPPGSVVEAGEDGTGCVLDHDGRAVPVQVVGSELGQTFVRMPEGVEIDQVQVSPDDDARCE